MSFMSRSKKADKKVNEYTIIQPAPTPPRPKPKPSVTPSYQTSGPASFIGKTMNIEGELFSDEDLTVEGKVKGTVNVSKTLIIGRSGDVTADINAKVVKIIGKARGTIVASEKVAILSEGYYSGSIHSEKLIVSEGAILIGHINQDPATPVLEEKAQSAPAEIAAAVEVPSEEPGNENKEETAAASEEADLLDKTKEPEEKEEKITDKNETTDSLGKGEKDAKPNEKKGEDQQPDGMKKVRNKRRNKKFR
ncbi:MAG: polymer-forming cytoskeletal protein [bacterium]|nr:polymer-forming cytoskeletal protein [bacterium]